MLLGTASASSTGSASSGAAAAASSPGPVASGPAAATGGEAQLDIAEWLFLDRQSFVDHPGLQNVEGLMLQVKIFELYDARVLTNTIERVSVGGKGF